MKYKYVSLPILFHTDETLELEKFGIEIYKKEDVQFQIKQVNFYQINGVFRADKNPYGAKTIIMSNGTTYESSESIENVMELIEKRLL